MLPYIVYLKGVFFFFYLKAGHSQNAYQEYTY